MQHRIANQASRLDLLRAAWSTRIAAAAADRRHQRVLVWLLALHIPVILAEWLLMDQAIGGLILVGLLGIGAVLGVSLVAHTAAVSAAAVRAGLALAAATILAGLPGPVLSRIPYVAVLLFAVLYVPRRLRPGGVPVIEADDEVASQVEELERMKAQLLAVASHEFRTPLTGMMGFARTMSTHLDDLDEDTLRLFVDSIEDHSRRLARLVDNLVATSRQPDPELDAVSDLHAVTAAVMAEFDPGVRAGNRMQVSLRGKLHAAIGEEAARRVLYNLLDNAVKFADPDTLIRLDARPQGGDVVIDVINVGPPIPSDLRGSLYEPFVQADSSDSRRADGLGLGLHVVRRLVEAHGGRVELMDGNGLTTFRVRLNRAPEVMARTRPIASAS